MHPSASIIHVYICICLPIYLYIYMFTSLSTCKAAYNIIWAPRSFQNNSLVRISQLKLCNNCWAKAPGQGLSSGGKGGYVFLTASVGMAGGLWISHTGEGEGQDACEGGPVEGPWRDPWMHNFKHTLLWSGKGDSSWLPLQWYFCRGEAGMRCQGTWCGAQVSLYQLWAGLQAPLLKWMLLASVSARAKWRSASAILALKWCWNSCTSPFWSSTLNFMI